ncbi:MAG: type II secretion system minor pseudopilin GspI [bacterium]
MRLIPKFQKYKLVMWAIEGFTLLEVMVSMAIISIVFVRVLISQSEGLKTIDHLKIKSKAVSLAKQKIEEIKLSDFPEIDSEIDQQEEGDKWFLWTKMVEKTSIDGLRKITLIVSWFEGKSKEEIFLSTYIVNKN